MKAEFTAVAQQVEEGWIGWIEEVPGVNCQEPTREELLDSLRQTLLEALQFNLEESLPEPERDANCWPVGFFEATAGSIPDFPEREPQGEYEQRLELEPC